MRFAFWIIKSFKSNFRQIILWSFLASVVLVTFFLFEKDVDILIGNLLKAADNNLYLIALLLFCVLASDVFLPIPSCLVSTACGTILGFSLGFLVSFCAMTVSSLIGYFVGRFCTSLASKLLNNKKSEIASKEKSFGPFWLLIMRPVPVLAECSVVYAGMRAYPLSISFIWLVLGNAAVSVVYAFIGACGLESGSVIPAFVAALALSALAILVNKFMRTSKAC